MNATERAMIIVRQLWYIAGCLQLIGGRSHA